MSQAIIDRLLSGDLATDFNWNSDQHPLVPLDTSFPPEPTAEQALGVEILSEDLRDGLHGVKEYPTVESMMEYVEALYDLGIRTMTVGVFPGEGNKIDESIKNLLKAMQQEYPEVTPVVLCLATEASLSWLEHCKALNSHLNAIVFMGTAPSRILVQEWTQDYILEKLAWATDTAVNKLGVEVIGATEHTTQTPPEFLKKIIETEISHGAKVFCIADTIGIARPIGAYRIVKFVRQVLDEMGAKEVLIDWHGHDDLGNAVANSLAAISAGADRVHTVARGRGERAGNTMMESVLLNLNAILAEDNQPSPWNLLELNRTLKLYDLITHSTPPEHGALGTRSNKTSLGMHTDAMQKAHVLAQEAREQGHQELAKRLEKMGAQIYTAVPPESVGLEHVIAVSPWSGKSTVRLASRMIGLDPTELEDEVVFKVLSKAKNMGRELTDQELKEMLF